MPSLKKIRLEAFWDAVERRLNGCSAEELRNILRGMAQGISPAARAGFLALLEPAEDMTDAVQAAVRQDDLLADIDDLLQALSAETKRADDEYEWGTYDDEDSLGPYQSFVETLAGLFDRTDAVFDAGDLPLARQAYERLFDALRLEDDYGRGVRIHDLPDVDARAARGRCLRAVYETEPLQRRPEVLLERFEAFQAGDFRSSPLLADLLSVTPRPLPDRDRFLEDWIAFLGQREGRSADMWLREAVRIARGTQGLEALARSEGERRPRAYLDWVVALAQEEKHREALAAAREALRALPEDIPLRAAIADRLCTAAAELHDQDALQAGRWLAFQAMPAVQRLVQLWEAVPGLEERMDWMHQAAQHVRKHLEHPPQRSAAWEPGVDALEMPVWVDKTMLAHAHLLGGDWEAAYRLGADAASLGWSSGMNPQGLVVAFFLIASSGTLPDALPANLAQLWREILGDVGFGVLGIEALMQSGAGGDDKQASLPARVNKAYTELLRHVTLPADRQRDYLPWCLEVARQRVQGIVGGQHRGSYAKAAVLISACAEVLRLRGSQSQAQALLAEIRSRFPRHSAFQREMRAATARIPQLGN